MEDNVLKSDGGIHHHGEFIESNHNLSNLVKQRYDTKLRSLTLASLKPEISQALDSLLDELYWSEELKVLRTAFRSSDSKSHRDRQPNLPKPQYVPKLTPIRPLCKQSGCGNVSHFLSACKLLPEQDWQFI